MLDPTEIGRQLVASGTLSAEQLERARRHAAQRRTSLTRSLAALGLATHADLGRCLSLLSGLPYAPLPANGPDTAARRHLAIQCAAAWQVAPTAYDPESQTLTVAVSDPEQAGLLADVYRFFLQPQKLAFTIASDAEIDTVLERGAGGEEKPAAAPEVASGKRKFAYLSAAGGPADARRRARRYPPGRKLKPGDLERPYRDMSRALVSAVTMLARSFLQPAPGELAAIRATVRYCELLASRVNLTPVQADGLTLAAWLSGLDGSPFAVEKILAPYGLAEAWPIADAPPEESRIETRILTLVRRYQDFKLASPAESRDLDGTRRYLHRTWSSASELQDLLETFLQVLADEKFLTRSERAGARVLVLDPDETVAPAIAPPLKDAGHEVVVVSGTDAAVNQLETFRPHLAIVAAVRAGSEGLTFCRRVAASPDPDRPPVVAVVTQDDEGRAAECLRAGANDFLTLPIRPELVLIKTDRLLDAAGQPPDEAGVSGTLEEMSFTDMIQILCGGGKSLEIVLSGDELEGRVFVEKGEIIHATAGELSGEAAFYRLMQRHSGRFSARRCAEFPTRTISAPVMSLLLEGTRLADEARADEAQS